MAGGTAPIDALLACAAVGEATAWGRRLNAHQQRLKRVVQFRMDPRVRGRGDATDIVQEAFVEASAHRKEYFRAHPPPPLFLGLRRVVKNKLLEVHRGHLGTGMRDAKRELPLEAARPSSDPTSAALWTQFTAGLTRPSVAGRKKRGGNEHGQPHLRINLDTTEWATDQNLDQILIPDDAICRMSQNAPDEAQVVRPRFYAGLSVGEAAKMMSVSEATVARLWRYARAWLWRELRPGETEA